MAEGFFKKEGRLLVHEIILIGILSVLTGARLLSGFWQLDISIAWWWLGAFIGFIFVFLDRIVYAFWQSSDQVMATTLKDILGRGKIGQGIAMLLTERETTERLIIRSALFLMVWLALAIFAVFSVANPFGRGFMFGLGIHLVTDLLRDYFGKGRDVNLWFWQIKRVIEPNEKQAVVWGFSILAILLMLGL